MVDEAIAQLARALKGPCIEKRLRGRIELITHQAADPLCEGARREEVVTLLIN